MDFTAIAKRVLRWCTTSRVALSPWELRFLLTGRRGNGRLTDVRQAARMLVIRLDEIGDVTLTSPLLRELRRSAPAARISLLVKPGVKNLVEPCPYVDEVLTFDGASHGAGEAARKLRRLFRFAAEELQPRRFDLVLLPRWDADLTGATLLAYLSGAPWRIGYSSDVDPVKARVNAGYDRLLTTVVRGEPLRHEAQRPLDLLRELGGIAEDERLELWRTPEDDAFADRFLAEANLTSEERLVVFNTGAGSYNRRWPIDHFAELAQWLCAHHKVRIVVTGGPDDVPAAESIAAAAPGQALILAGRATLRQTEAVLTRCHLYVGTNSGPMHLAVAAGLPTIEISCHPRSGSPTFWYAPERFGPWLVSQRVLQPEQGCDDCREGCLAQTAHCILGVGVEQVAQAIDELLATPVRVRTAE